MQNKYLYKTILYYYSENQAYIILDTAFFAYAWICNCWISISSIVDIGVLATLGEPFGDVHCLGNRSSGYCDPHGNVRDYAA